MARTANRAEIGAAGPADSEFPFGVPGAQSTRHPQDDLERRSVRNSAGPRRLSLAVASIAFDLPARCAAARRSGRRTPSIWGFPHGKVTSPRPADPRRGVRVLHRPAARSRGGIL